MQIKVTEIALGKSLPPRIRRDFVNVQMEADQVEGGYAVEVDEARKALREAGHEIASSWWAFEVARNPSLAHGGLIFNEDVCEVMSD